MKVTFDRAGLHAALKRIKPAIAQKDGMLPILTGAHVSVTGARAVVTGSDLDLMVSAEVGCHATGPLEAVIPYRTLAAAVSLMESDTVTLEVLEEGRTEERTVERRRWDSQRGRTVYEKVQEMVTRPGEVLLTGGPVAVTMLHHPSDSWPKVSGIHQDPTMAEHYPAERLVAAMRAALPAASWDRNRPIITGVLVKPDAGHVVTTDSYRLIQVVADVGHLPKGVIVPGRVVPVVDGAEVLAYGENDVTFIGEGWWATTRLIEGEYPNYRGLIPSTPPLTVRLEKAALAAAVKRLRRYAVLTGNADAGVPMRATFDGPSLSLRFVVSDHSSWHEEVEISDTLNMTFAIGFNPRYLLEGLAAVPGPTIDWGFVDHLKPSVIWNPERTFMYLIMPVRMS